MKFEVDDTTRALLEEMEKSISAAMESVREEQKALAERIGAIEEREKKTYHSIVDCRTFDGL